MECNKDEANRAREIAETKLASQDYHGALKFVQKAQQLFPGLENLAQMSAVIDVHVAAQVKVNGAEPDWYGILQVESRADDAVIKKQYRRLALLLHPDKNKFAGAEAAFKLIGEASQILSDKDRRQQHDFKRMAAAKTTKAAQQSQSRRAHQTTGHSHGNKQYSQFSAPHLLPTFWTACPSCHMRFQYLRTFENQNLLCAHCRVAFFARDIQYAQGGGAYNPYGWSAHYSSQQNINHSSSQPFLGAQQQGFYHSSSQSFPQANKFTTASKVKAPHIDDATYGGANTSSVPAMGQAKPDAEQVHREKQQVCQSKESGDKVGLEQNTRNKRKDELRREKEAEKEFRRIEKEQQKKVKADLRTQEALEKLMKKRKEQAEKATTKEKRRRLKKRDSSEDEDDESNSLDDFSSDDWGIDEVVQSQTYPRRSSRPRRNVTYRVDASDDEGGDIQGSKADGDDECPDMDNSKEIGKGLDQRDKDTKGFDEKGNETKSGIPDADLKEKEKLADFAKSKIRLSLNLQGGRSMASMPDLESQGRKGLKDVSGVPVNEARHSDKAENCDTGKANVKEDHLAEKQGEPEQEVNELPEEEPEPEEFSVPDADFYDFDKHREEKDVHAGQIWAAYDDKDGMPRFYFRVKEVKSRIPFKVTISWLELRNLSEEQEELKDLGFYFTSGNCFKNSNTKVIDSVNLFSHIVNWEKGPKGAIIIYPRTADIWALYRDWEPGLEFMDSNRPLKYDMVEVLMDFTEQAGVRVARLDKLIGFKTVFKRIDDFLEIPATEICRFSHQVPAHMLQGDEAPGIPKGCWQLDPASVPMDLIFTSPDAEKSR